VNDIAIPAYERVPMQTGDVIVFGTGAAFLYLSAEALFLLLQSIMR
jgi:hypothetical protein